MPSERAIVETLNRKELLELVAHFDLKVGDRRVRDNLIDALASSRETKLDQILGQLSVASLKEVCRKHGLDDSGRTKAQLIARILGDKNGVASKKASKKAVAKQPAVKTASKRASAGKKAPAKALKNGRALKEVSKETRAPEAKEPAKKASKAKAAPATRGKVATKVAPTKAAGSKAAVKAVPPAPAPEPAKTVESKAKPKSKAAAPQIKKSAPPSNVIELDEARAKGAEKKPAPLNMPREAPNYADLVLPPQPGSEVRTCQACAAELTLRKCQVQKCNNFILATPTRKICAECLFERNTLSMTEFNQRLEEETKCPHCGQQWQRVS